ncbi:MAG: elongation factor P [Myxococcales bacterium]|nr:elongation factor P [Myxococcales bacterium]
MSYETSDFRNGLKVETEGNPFVIVYFQFVKPGKGTAFTRTKLKNLLTGAVIERTYRSGEILAEADVEEHPMQFLYANGGIYTFMNTETYDQVELQGSMIGDDAKFLMANLDVNVLFYKGRAVNLTLPNFIESRVVSTEPAVKGNTSQGALKAAVLECGAEIMVPLFVDGGDMIKVDTREGGSYVSRIGK